MKVKPVKNIENLMAIHLKIEIFTSLSKELNLKSDQIATSGLKRVRGVIIWHVDEDMSSDMFVEANIEHACALKNRTTLKFLIDSITNIIMNLM